MYYIIKKSREGQRTLKGYSEDKTYLIHLIAGRLKKEQKEKKNFTFRLVKILENKKYRNCVQTSEGNEYIVVEENSISLKGCI